MIVVRVELWSARTGARQEIARMRIANVGENARRDDATGTYQGVTFRGRSGSTLDRADAVRTARVSDYRRRDQHVWNLVAKMLSGMGYGA